MAQTGRVASAPQGRAVAGIKRFSGEDLRNGTILSKNAILEVEWLDEHRSLNEQELLLQTTTIGRCVSQTNDMLIVANRSNPLDDGDVTLIDSERVLQVLEIILQRRRRQ